MTWRMVLSADYSNFHQNPPKICSPRCFVTVCIVLSLLLSGCVMSTRFIDEPLNAPVYFGVHVVRRGETLYSIAKRYSREFSELAGANGIAPPYIIHPGQKLDLEKRVKLAPRAAPAVKNPPQNSANVTEGKSRNEAMKTVTESKKANEFKEIKWRWPHIGPILAKYTHATDKKSNLSNKGLDVGGKVGDPIYAAAPGEVVYAGSGLLGYGNLVIITHDDRYLSAYAHNRKLLVTEGQQIEQGQQIAELGASGSDQPKLHFEIRRDGQPVDPLQYLPKINNLPKKTAPKK